MFVINIKYDVSFEEIQTILPEHRNYLKEFYDKNKLVCSGPKSTLDGGFVMTRFTDEQEVKDFIENDPFKTANFATYSFFSFNPVLHDQDFKQFID